MAWVCAFPKVFICLDTVSHSDCPSPGPAPLNNADKTLSGSGSILKWRIMGWRGFDFLFSMIPNTGLPCWLELLVTALQGKRNKGKPCSYSALKNNLSMPPLPFSLFSHGSKEYFTGDLPCEFQVDKFVACTFVEDSGRSFSVDPQLQWFKAERNHSRSVVHFFCCWSSFRKVHKCATSNRFGAVRLQECDMEVVYLDTFRRNKCWNTRNLQGG